MRTLVVDGRMGASGDMLLGALLAAGADRSVLAPVEAALPITYVEETVTRNGIQATQVQVRYTAAADVGGHEEDHGHHHDDDHADPHGHHHGDDHADPHGHHPDHPSDNSHDHDHKHGPGQRDESGHTHAEGQGPTRALADIEGIIDGMDLPDPVRDDAVETFELLAEAESAVHGTDLESTTVHEVGADDAIADVVGSALLLADLDVERVAVLPVSTGSGEATMAHGTYPIPPPAVVQIAERADWSLSGGPVEGELLTPTGAAILAHYGEGVDALPALNVEMVGYGAGARTYPDRPNVLRVLLGDDDGAAGIAEPAADELALTREPIAIVETTVDDVTPEVLGSLHETLAAAGALDVSVVPTGMKKSRPGHIVQAIVAPADTRAVAARLARETGSLGVRVVDSAHRWIADRSVETVEIEVDGNAFEVGVKVATDASGVRYDASAEYDDAMAVARETGLAVRDVMHRAERVFENST